MTFLFSPTNHLLELARSGKRLPHILLAIFLAFIFVLVAQFAGGIPAIIIVVLLSMLESGASFDDPQTIEAMVLPNTALEQAIFLMLAFLPIFLILWGWLALFEKRPFWTIGLERAGMVKKYLRGALIGLLMFVASIGISAAMGFMAFEDGSQQGVAVLGGVVLVFFGWMVQGAAEEALTPRWLFPVIGARYNTQLGLIVSSLVFAALHSLNFIGLDMNPAYIALAMLNLFLFGVFTVLFALYEGGLWVSLVSTASGTGRRVICLALRLVAEQPPAAPSLTSWKLAPILLPAAPLAPKVAWLLPWFLLSVVLWWCGHRKKQMKS